MQCELLGFHLGFLPPGICARNLHEITRLPSPRQPQTSKTYTGLSRLSSLLVLNLFISPPFPNIDLEILMISIVSHRKYHLSEISFFWKSNIYIYNKTELAALNMYICTHTHYVYIYKLKRERDHLVLFCSKFQRYSNKPKWQLFFFFFCPGILQSGQGEVEAISKIHIYSCSILHSLMMLRRKGKQVKVKEWERVWERWAVMIKGQS